MDPQELQDFLHGLLALVNMANAALLTLREALRRIDPAVLRDLFESLEGEPAQAEPIELQALRRLLGESTDGAAAFDGEGKWVLRQKG